MDPERACALDHARCRASIGLVAVLVYACARIVLPFAFILIWSAILAVMLYPLISVSPPGLGIADRHC